MHRRSRGKHLLRSTSQRVLTRQGGYNLTSISESALAVTKTLMGEPPARFDDRTPSPRAVETLHRVCLEQSKYWHCMRPLAFNNKPIYKTSTRLHDVVRSYQAQELRKKYKMTTLPLLEDRSSASFENQALATSDFHSRENLLFFIHDAPEVLSNPHASENRLLLHDTYMVSQATELVDAITNPNSRIPPLCLSAGLRRKTLAS